MFCRILYMILIELNFRLFDLFLSIPNPEIDPTIPGSNLLVLIGAIGIQVEVLLENHRVRVEGVAAWWGKSALWLRLNETEAAEGQDEGCGGGVGERHDL